MKSEYRALWKNKIWNVMQIDYHTPQTVILSDGEKDYMNVPLKDVELIKNTEKEAKRIALTYATISLGVYGIGGFITYLGYMGIVAGVSTIREFCILYLACTVCLWLILYFVTKSAFRDEKSYAYWFNSRDRRKSHK